MSIFDTAGHRAAIAAVRKSLGLYTEPRWPAGGVPHSTIELLAGAEFLDVSVLMDCRAYLGPMLEPRFPHKLPSRLLKAVRSLHAGASQAMYRMVERQCEIVLAEVHSGTSPVLAETARVVEDLRDRVLVYSAAVGCPRASARCAVLCLAEWRKRNIGGAVNPVTYGLMLSMVEFLDAAGRIEETDVESYIQETRRVQLDDVRRQAHGLVHVLGIVQSALAQGADGEDAAPADDLSALALLDDDRAGIVRNKPTAPVAVDTPTEDGKTWGLGDLPAVPGVVVLRDLAHLPKGRKDGDPAKEAGPLVGVRVPLVTPPADLAVTRAALLSEFPHLARLVDRILRPLATQDTIRLPHILLWGPPGCAKTRFARRLGEVLDLAPSITPMGGVSDSMLGGTSRGWSSARFCLPFAEMLRTLRANPMIVCDEIEKTGTGRQNGNAIDVLLQMTGEETSARYRDPYLEAPIDASRVNWVFTANSIEGLPRPFLDRCLVLRVDEPGPEHLRVLATSILEEVRADRGLDEVWAPPFDGMEWAALEEFWPRGGSLRGLKRLVEGVLDARDGGLRQ